MAGLSSRVIQSPRLLSAWVCLLVAKGVAGAVRETQVQVLALPLIWVSHLILEDRELSAPL